MFTGRILEAEIRTNELTNHPFRWVLVETLGGVFDVVADPDFHRGGTHSGRDLDGIVLVVGAIADLTVGRPNPTMRRSRRLVYDAESQWVSFELIHRIRGD